jgi:hypothetical protein
MLTPQRRRRREFRRQRNSFDRWEFVLTVPAVLLRPLSSGSCAQLQGDRTGATINNRPRRVYQRGSLAAQLANARTMAGTKQGYSRSGSGDGRQPALGESADAGNEKQR